MTWWMSERSITILFEVIGLPEEAIYDHLISRTSNALLARTTLRTVLQEKNIELYEYCSGIGITHGN